MGIIELYTIYLQHPVIVTDSRKIEKGCLFFALKGENFNGNTFASDAIDRGAAYAIVDEEEYHLKNETILVQDVLSALQDLAKYHREQLHIPIIGLTGSNGKTTTKELIHAVLSKKYHCLATIGNLNNHIGVPLTLLRIKKEHEIAIIEMGANHVGEIEFLCNIAKPDFGLITNIGRAHLGEFGGFEKVIQTKMELYDSILESKGLLFVNGDDPLLMERSSNHNRVIYGKSENHAVQANYLSQDPFLNVVWNNHQIEIRSHLVGRYNFDNILVAIALGDYFKVKPEDIQIALNEYTPSNNRSQIVKTDKNILIMDAYNANPSSVTAAIENLVSMSGDHKFFMLGDMLELGNESAKEHQFIYDLVIKHQLHGVFIGEEFSKIFNTTENMNCYKTTEIALEEISKYGLKDHLILLKGSRGMRLERLQELL